MERHFAAAPLSNSTRLCIGCITRSETEAAQSEGLDVDGYGYYLFLADESALDQPIEVLARFLSAGRAEALMRMFEPLAGCASAD